MNRRMTIYVLILYGLMAVVAFWSLGRMFEARAAARKAAADLAECNRYAEVIERLRVQPTVAAERERMNAEITGPIEKAARSAGIAADRLARISPEPAQRVGESAYKEKPTRFFLKNVTLQQVISMVYGLTESNEGLNLKSVRLAALSRDVPGGTWSAELVLAYLIYDPQRSSLKEGGM